MGRGRIKERWREEWERARRGRVGRRKDNREEKEKE